MLYHGPIIECIKKGSFEWTKVAQKAFELIKQKLCQASVLALSNFKDLFEFEYGANAVGNGVVLV